MRALVFLLLPLFALADTFSVERTFTEDGQLESALVKFYDKEGRLAEESLYGNLTGGFTHKLTFAKSGLPQEPYECYSKRYTYGSKGQLLRVREDDGTCLENLWSEDKKTLQATFTMQGRRILLRTFYEKGRTLYDNGKSPFKDNLEGVTYRDIVEIRESKQETEVQKAALDISSREIVLQNRTVSNLDANGKVSARRLYDSSGALLSEEHFQYERDLLRTYIDPCEAHTTYLYKDGLCCKQLGPEQGCERLFIYDKDKGLLRTEIYQDAHLLDVEIPPTQNKQILPLTARKQPCISHTDEGTCTLRYSLSGRLLAETWETGRQRNYGYTETGELQSCTDIHHSGEANITEYNYSGKRLIGEKTDLYTKTYSLDAFGNTSCETTQWKDGISKQVFYERGARGEILVATSGQERKTFQYDASLRLVNTQVLHDRELQNELSLRYDAAANITERTENGEREATNFDALRRPLRHFDKAGRLTSYEYEGKIQTSNLSNGLCEHKTENSWTLFTPDKKPLWAILKTDSETGWCKTESLFDAGSCVHVSTTSAILGPKKEILSLNRDGVTESYCYDNFGRISQTRQQEGPHLQRTYDAQGRLESLISSDNTVHYKFDYKDCSQSAIDLVHSRVQTSNYDCRGHLIADGFCQLTRDQNGRLESCFFTDGHGFVCNYQGMNLVQIRYIHNAKVLLSHPFSNHHLGGLPARQGDGEVYIYNEEGAAIDTPAFRILKAGPGKNSLPAETLFKDSCPIRRQRITYDAGTCIRSQTCPETGDLQPACILVNGSNFMPKQGPTFIKDLRGRVHRKITAEQSLIFTYDALDRCICTQGDDFTAHHSYDPQNRRVATTLLQGKKVSHFTYSFLGDREVACFEDKKLITARMLHPETGETLYVFSQGKLWRCLEGPSGSPSLLRSPSGKDVQSYRYNLQGLAVCFDEGGRRLDLSMSLSPWLFEGRRLERGGYYLVNGCVMDPDF